MKPSNNINAVIEMLMILEFIDIRKVLSFENDTKMATKTNVRANKFLSKILLFLGIFLTIQNFSVILPIYSEIKNMKTEIFTKTLVDHKPI